MYRMISQIPNKFHFVDRIITLLASLAEFSRSETCIPGARRTGASRSNNVIDVTDRTQR